MLNGKLFLFVFSYFFLVPITLLHSETIRVQLRVVSVEERQPVPCKVRLETMDGTPVAIKGEYDYRGWFPIRGEQEIEIEPGPYILRASRGIETVPTYQKVNIHEDGQNISVSLHRWIDMNRLGWWSGDTHVHRPLEVIEDLVLAEDLNVAPVLTYWNDRSMIKNNETPSSLIQKIDRHHVYSILNEEHEKQGGAVLVFNLKAPIPVAGYDAWTTDALSLIRETHAQGGWVEIEKPFWLDAPLWLALGEPHSVGIVNNHFWELSTLNNEAWGRKQDPEYLKEPIGLAHYVMDLYYKMLNCGYRLSAVGGSASGVLDNPVGHNRTYVYLGKNFGYKNWYDGLRKGRNFATNGPMIFAEINGNRPGIVLKSDSVLELDVRAAALNGIAKIEWIADGDVLASYTIDPPCREVRIQDRTYAEGKHWLAVRVFERSHPEVVRFGHTSPFYIEGANPAYDHSEDVKFFIDWLDQRINQTNDPKQIPNEIARRERIRNLEKARDVFEKLLPSQ